MLNIRMTERNEIRTGEERRQPLFDSYLENSLRFDADRCINCKRCLQVCPHAVFTEGTDHVEPVNTPACMECGACALNCPVQAITVQSGVGCAWAMIGAALRGRDMDTECRCGGDDGTCCSSRPGDRPTEPGCGSKRE